jgi:hypothetical protein
MDRELQVRLVLRNDVGNEVSNDVRWGAIYYVRCGRNSGKEPWRRGPGAKNQQVSAKPLEILAAKGTFSSIR